MPSSRLIVAALLVVLCGFSHNLPMHGQQVAGTPAATTAQVHAATTTTLQVSPASGAVGSKFILSASVTVRGGPETTGTVSFYNGADLLGTADILTQANAHGAVGSASFVTRGLRLGANAITANFNGAGLDSPSGSAVRNVTVSGIYPSATALTATGEHGTYQLSAAVLAGGRGTPIGTVTFTDVTTKMTLGIAAVGASTTTFFANPPNPNFNSGQVTLGDVNGDGIEDTVAPASYYYPAFLVSLGNGDGTFASPTFVAAANLSGTASTVTLADLNGDGNLDIIATTNFSGDVVVILGNGDGTFGEAAEYPADVNASSLAVADFDGDGKLDVATANSYSGTMSILLGKGDGSFQAPHSYSTGASAGDPDFSVTVGDYNGDHKIDAAVSNQEGTISLFLGKGDGTFAPPVRLTGATSSADGPHAIATGDINRDGKLDLVIANTEVGIYYGKGDGTFQPIQQYSVTDGVQPTGVVVADINGDGKPDIAVSSETEFSLAVLLNNGNQTFQAAGYAFGSGAQSLAVGDLNSDGIQDIVEGNRVLIGQTAFTSSLAQVSLPGSGSDIVSSHYSGDASFAGSTSNPVTIPTKSAAAGPYPTTTTLTASGSQGSYQLNAAVISSGAGTPTGTVTFTDSTTHTTLGTAAAGASTTTFTEQPSIDEPAGASDMAIGDVNGDGVADVVVVSEIGVTVAFGHGDGTFASPTFVTSAVTNYGGPAVALADLNRDGHLDIIVASSIVSGVVVLLGNGNGTFGAEKLYPLASFPISLAVADFNGDGKLDIATANHYPQNSMSILLGKGDGTFQAEHAYPADVDPQSVTVGDYNGDGKIDVAVINATGTISHFQNKGDGTFAVQPLLSVASGGFYSGPRGIATGDLNGDGKLDLVIANGNLPSVGVLYGRANGTFQAIQQLPLFAGIPFMPLGVVVADINGDGKPDMVVSNGGVVGAAVLLNKGNETFQTAYYDEALAPSLAVGDLNGDGILDFILSTGSGVDVLLGQTTFTTSLAHLSLPGSGSETVSATYSGDTHFAGSTSNTLTLPTKSSAAVGSASDDSSAARPTIPRATGTSTVPTR